MDEMKLNLISKFMRNIVAKLLSKTIYKKTGCKVDIQLNELKVSVIDGDAFVSTSVEARLDSHEFTKIMKSIDLDY